MSETKSIKSDLDNSKKKFDVGSWLIPIIAVFIALFIGGILIKLQGLDPVVAYKSLFKTAFGSIEGIGATLGKSTPLVLSGLAVAVGLRAGLFNIGAQGQFIFGAIGASYVGFQFDLPPVIHPIAAILAGVFLAGIYGGIVGLLKAKTGAHEVIVTIMLNYIAGFFILWILKTSAFLRPGRIDPLAPEVNPSAQLPKLFGEDLRIHSGIFIAILATMFVAWLLRSSTLGFKFRAVGSNASAARTAGISVPFVTTSTMFICGGLAGLGGAIHLIGTEYSLGAGIAGSLGFDAITVALLGQATPIGTLFGALLFGALQTGSRTLLSNTGTSPDIVQVIQALIVLFIAAPPLMKTIFRIKRTLNDKSMAAKGWNG